MAKKIYLRNELVFQTRPKNPKFIDRTGQRFHRLVVVGFAGKSGARSYWFCQCDCSRICSVESSCLVAGNTKSCGCLGIEAKRRTGKRNATHGETITVTTMYSTWSGIKTRCFNKRDHAFGYYGGRGITMHPDWVDSYVAFRDYVLENLGPKPSTKHSLDRTDNDGNYEPGNLKWSTKAEQRRNTRATLMVDCKSFADKYDEEPRLISYGAAYSRMKRGWCVQCALALPPQQSCRHGRAGR